MKKLALWLWVSGTILLSGCRTMRCGCPMASVAPGPSREILKLDGAEKAGAPASIRSGETVQRPAGNPDFHRAAGR